MAWVPMRKAVADMPRLTEVYQAVYERNLQALAMVNVPQPVKTV